MEVQAAEEDRPCRTPQQEGYFQPPDLEVFFGVAFARLQEADDATP